MGGVGEEGLEGCCFSRSLGAEEGREEEGGGGEVELGYSKGVGVEESVRDDCRDVRDWVGIALKDGESSEMGI